MNTTSINPKSTIALLLCLYWPAFSHAQPFTQEQYLAMIDVSVEKVINIYDGTWAYSYTSYSNLDNESITHRIDPSQPFMQSDRIIAENGGEPSSETLERHERLMQRRQRRRGISLDRALVEEEKDLEGDEKERFRNLLIRDSVKLVRQEGDLHFLEFRGMEENRRTIYEHLIGTLVLDTRNEYIKELRVTVTEPFSPFFIMRINAGYFALRFELQENGRPIQTDANWQLDGHILYLKDLDRDQRVEWFDIEKVSADTD